MQPFKILVVEDEPIIALALRLELEGQGHQLLLASDADEAMRLCARHLPNVAILNFYFKNKMDGRELARLLRHRWQLRVCFVTGARRQDMESKGELGEGQAVLHKPFTVRQLHEFLFPLFPAKAR